MEKTEKLNTYQHKFGHYCFELECHPDDDPRELEKELRDLHLDKD